MTKQRLMLWYMLLVAALCSAPVIVGGLNAAGQPKPWRPPVIVVRTQARTQVHTQAHTQADSSFFRIPGILTITADCEPVFYFDGYVRHAAVQVEAQRQITLCYDIADIRRSMDE